MDTTNVVSNIVVSIVATLFIYLVVPLLLCFNPEKVLTRRRAKKIIIINAICGFLLFTLLRFLTNVSTFSAAPAILWSCITYSIVKKRCSEEEPIIQKNSKPKEKRFQWYHIVSIVLSILSIVTIIVAMNVQDYSRNTYEDLNPTVLYSILIAINIAYISVLLFVRERLILKSSVGISLVLYSIFTLIEGSIFSDAHYGYRYHNFGYVSSCNLIWISLSYISFIMGIIIPFILVLHSKWHRTIAYREKCYKRVAKMKSYLDSGIISQEEYEKNKQDILKNIEK